MKLAPAIVAVGLAIGIAVAAPIAASAAPVDSNSTPTVPVDANYADFPQLPTLPLKAAPTAQSGLAYTGGEVPTTALWIGAGIAALGAGLVSVRLVSKRAAKRS